MMFTRLLCAFGVHGPEWFGADSTTRSTYVAPCIRECSECGAMWVGGQVEISNMRTLGDWVLTTPEQHAAIAKVVK